jgi:hypothetical protein
VYAIPPPATEWGFVDFAPLGQNRAGLMTMPAMLTILSHPLQTSITRRGLFAQDYLYCQQAPPPPGVDITVDPQPGQTLRQFMEAHGTSPSCVGCHMVMDPIAFAFENFDAIGRFRVNEVPAGTGGPVDTTATNVVLFDGTTFGDGAYADAVEWASEAVKPAMRPKLSRCWVDQIYRNAVGASAGPDQDALLAALDTSFAGPASDQYLLLALLSELVSSPAFGQVGDPR